MLTRVLVVDDEASVHEALAPVLDLEGIGVRSARSLVEAGRLLDLEAFDLVLVDLSLNGAMGTEGLLLIDKLHKERPRLPVVLFTARGTEEIFARAIAHGAAAAWSKDLPIGDLVRRLKEVGSNPAP